MWLFYQLAVGLALLAAGPFLLLLRGKHYLPTIKHRLGLAYPRRQPADRRDRAETERPVWLHAVSVGEVGVAATLARALPPDLPLLVTTVTPTGQKQARQAFRGRAEVSYLPYDLGFAVERFFRRFRPRALILAEGDLWPLVLRRARRESLPIAVINGRVSDSSFRRMRRLRSLLEPVLEPVERFGVQTGTDRDRLARLGVPEQRLFETGNLKFESPAPAARPEAETLVLELAAGRPVLIAGSTMAGEEPMVLEAFAAAGGGERALLVLAPRHPERFDEVHAAVASAGLPATRRSAPTAAAGRPAVLLLDSLGELAALYRLAASAFVGGTLVPTGGHNPLEPARFGVAVAAGPGMDNFRAIAQEFDRLRAWRRVADPQQLAAAWREWLDDPEEAKEVGARGRALVEANRGALERTLAMLRPLLETGA